MSRLAACGALALLLSSSAAPVHAAEKNGYQVNGFVGSFSTGVPIQVPSFHGIEPRISLSYSSEGRNGIVGAGWRLNGFSQIMHRNESYNHPGTGWPLLLELDGQALVACPGGSSFPSCASGGTHYTRNESYLKIVKTSEAEWSVYGKDGTRTKFSSLAPADGLVDYTWKLGQSQVVDTHGNTVNYTWWNPDGGVGHYYPGTVSYNGYTIEFFYETRPDALTAPIRHAATRTITHRLKTIKVRLTAGALIRAYKLTYATAPQSGKSLLTSVQQFGKDAILDGAGTVTGGTSLPAQVFAYQADGSAHTFGGDVQLTAAPPPEPTVENVVWTYLQNATGEGNNLRSLVGDPENPDWKIGYSTRAVLSGTGYAEATFWPSANSRFFHFGPMNAYMYPDNAGVSFYMPGIGYVGPYAVSGGQAIRITVTPTTVAFSVNGTQVASYAMTATYPVGLYGGLWGDNEVIHNVRISGVLQGTVAVDCGGQPRYPADLNGDGRQDMVCRNPNSGSLVVTLATSTGFGPPQIWGSTGESHIRAGDFTGDGKADILAWASWAGHYYLYPSTGTSFGAMQNWGESVGVDSFYGTAEACRMNAYLGPVGDYNGDGKADIACVGTIGYASDQNGSGMLVSYSTGSGFTSYRNDICGISPTLKAMDWNGDGLEDLHCSSSEPDQSYVYGIRPNYGMLPLANRNAAFCSYGGYWTGDVNGDGRSDMGCTYGNVLLGGAYYDLANQGAFCVSGQTLIEDLDGDGAAEWICNSPGSGSDDILVRRWMGTGFGATTTWRAGFCSGAVTPGDFNGDGKVDLFCEASQSAAYAGTKGLRGDLMTTVSNGIGGSTSVVYAPSTNYSTLNGASPKYVITSMSQNDGRGGIDVTAFAYENSFEDDKEKKWNGFSKVTTTRPLIGVETVGPKTITGYIVQGPAAGSVDWVESRDGLNRLLSYTKNTYVTSDAGNRQTSLLNIVESERYDGTTTARCSVWPCANARRTKVMHAYDGTYGNLTTSVNFGDLDTTGDEVTTGNYFAPNPSAYIVGLLGASNQFEGLAAFGNLLSSVVNAYDGAGWWNTPPVKGDATTRAVWLKDESRYLSTTTAYDAYGNATSSTDPTGKTMAATYETTYNAFPISATNGAGETTATTWDYLCAAPLTTTDPNGQTSTTAYDALCRPTAVNGPLGMFQSSAYLGMGDANAQHSRVETPGPDGSNDWSESYFDGWGRTYRTVKRGPTTGTPIIVDVDFDARGNVAQSTSPYYAGETEVYTTFEYDGFNRPVKTTLPDGKTRLTAYPALAADGLFVVTSTNELGQSSSTKTNVFGQTRKQEKVTTLHGTLVTTLNYNLWGHMTSLVDPLGNTWSYTFDNLGRNLTKADPDAGTWTYAYDDAGRVVNQQDAKAQTTTLEYDAAGRAQYKRLRPVGGPTGAITETVETVYGTSSAAFNIGRVAQLVRKNGAGVEQNGKLAFEYDALGRVKKQTRTIDSTNYVVERNYDAAGYLRGMKYPDNDILGEFGGTGTALGYDGAGRLSSIPGILSSVTYNALGAPLVQTNANGTTTTKTYDANRFWLTDIDTSAPSLTLQNLHYTLNDAGMATAVDSDVTNESWAYAYDELNRLTSSTNGVGANDQSWTYDAIGRFITNSRVGSAFNYPGVGNARPHAPTQISGGPLGLLNFAYDANGNMQSGNGRSMSWNPENMITQVVANSRTTTFTYGPDGDRIKKAEGSTVMRYPFGDDYEIATDGTVTKYFNAGFGPIAKKVGGTLYWLHTDRLGSINATTDDTGAQVLRRSFRSYGELLGQTGTHAESLGYIGQRTDAETANGTTDDKGLTYLHARYYDSALGLFVSPDPIGADLNTYRYVGGDPANGTDRSGLLKDECEETFDPNCGFSTDPMLSMSMEDFSAATGSSAAMVAAMGFPSWMVDGVAAHDQRLIQDGFGGVYTYQDSAGRTRVTLSPTTSAGDVCRASLESCSADPMTTKFTHLGTGTQIERTVMALPEEEGGEVAAGPLALGIGLARALAARAAFVAAAVNVIARMATHPGTTKGLAVLGKSGEYVERAEQLGATYFRMPDRVWGTLSRLGVNMWDVNRAFLDRLVSQGYRFNIAGPRTYSFGQEVDYLVKTKGYIDLGTSLVPGGG
ncbi:MAG: VCBS repeat-containing protein [Vicinamibacteria bacterium]|nr:VCBS repeat-containing protein [Vicinamibacteria bacterium]